MPFTFGHLNTLSIGSAMPACLPACSMLSNKYASGQVNAGDNCHVNASTSLSGAAYKCTHSSPFWVLSLVLFVPLWGCMMRERRADRHLPSCQKESHAHTSIGWRWRWTLGASGFWPGVAASAAAAAVFDYTSLVLFGGRGKRRGNGIHTLCLAFCTQQKAAGPKEGLWPYACVFSSYDAE